MSLNAPIITMIELIPNPVDAGTSFVIKVSIEEATHERLTLFTHGELNSYTHEDLGTKELA